MDTRILLAVCFSLFFIVIFLLQQIMGNCSEQFIPGFWAVSEQFKEEANIDQLIIYFDKGKGYDYKGYMVMVVDGETIFNASMNFKITPKGYFKSDSYKFTTEEDINVMPRTMTMVICPYEGSMTLKCLKSKNIYARLFKDNQMSAKTILDIGDAIHDSEEDISEESVEPLEDIENS